MTKIRGGFTLLELMVAILILVVGIVGILTVYIYCYSLNEISRNTTQATNDARAVLEAMRDESTVSLWSVENTNWESWAEGLTTTQSGKTNNTPLTSLPQEDIDVAISEIGEPPLKIEALQVTVTVSWFDKGVRQRQISFTTLLAERSET